MADLKISQLSAATALAGTEVVPVVQSGSTKKATIDQILKPAAGKGIDFSANTGSAGMTSELLDWYEEGLWTPTGNGISYSSAAGLYTRVGNLITVFYQVTFPTTADTNQARLGGLPFASTNTTIVVVSGASDLALSVDGNTFARFANLAFSSYKSNADLSGLTLRGQITYRA